MKPLTSLSSNPLIKLKINRIDRPARKILSYTGVLIIDIKSIYFDVPGKAGVRADNELGAGKIHYINGIRVDKDTAALGVKDKVSPGEHHVTEGHNND